MSIFRLVEKFNNHVIGINREAGTITDKDEFEWFIGCCLEELTELKEAHNNGDFISEIDAVMDLIYFSAGALVRMGISSDISDQIFLAIHNCNMTKDAGKKAGRVHEHALDAIKNPNWVGPEERIMEILENNNG